MADSKPAKSDAKQQPIDIIRRGAIAASIWRRQTSTGFTYIEFSISRSWRTKAGDKEGYSSNFFEENETALREVITEACQFIREFERGRGEGRRTETVSVDQAEQAPAAIIV